MRFGFHQNMMRIQAVGSDPDVLATLGGVAQRPFDFFRHMGGAFDNNRFASDQISGDNDRIPSNKQRLIRHMRHTGSVRILRIK